jgi:hypothetical protein
VCGFAAQIGCSGSEAIVVHSTVPYQNEPCIVRYLSPFVEIEGDRVGTLDTIQAWCNIGRKHGERAIRAVNMEPQRFVLSNVCQHSEIVDGADIHAACSCAMKNGVKPTLRSAAMACSSVALFI